MAINFSDTLTAIYADLNHRSPVVVSLLCVLMLCWFAWLFWMPLTVIKEGAGQVEVNQPALALVAASSGRIASVNIQTGDEVAAQQALIELNGEDERHQIASLHTSVSKQREALAALQNTQSSELEALRIEILALEQKIKNIRAQIATVQEQFDQQNQTVAMLGRANSAVSKIEFQREQLQLKEIQERLLIRIQELANLQADTELLREREHLLAARIAQANANHQALIASLERELVEQEQLLKHKTLTVPVAATVAEVMPLQPGQWIESGQKLASLLPAGDLRIVAQFKPTDAQGYLQTGQRAKVHVESFPWLQYGALDAHIIRIDQAERQGLIRVLLELDANSLKLLPLQHGMGASIHVFVAHATPWQLLLQSLGQRQRNR